MRHPLRVVQKTERHDAETSGFEYDLETLGLEFSLFDTPHAHEAASMWAP